MLPVLGSFFTEGIGATVNTTDVSPSAIAFNPIQSTSVSVTISAAETRLDRKSTAYSPGVSTTTVCSDKVM